MVRGLKQRLARRSDQPANHVKGADMTRIGVLADTHLRSRKPSIPAAVLRGLQGVDLILHAGDICCASVLKLLGDIAPVVAVHGNVDPPDLQSALPADRVVNCDNVCIGLTHGHLGTRRT
ncbi:MAG: YfcE family phosphodiesterase, partial [Chloroflexi bacterium]|nr:YfcE family phosphodiesterase [Chloroflexota bacterium]